MMWLYAGVERRGASLKNCIALRLCTKLGRVIACREKARIRQRHPKAAVSSFRKADEFEITRLLLSFTFSVSSSSPKSIHINSIQSAVFKVFSSKHSEKKAQILILHSDTSSLGFNSVHINGPTTEYTRLSLGLATEET